jgi:hypothetical protein
MLGLPQCRPEGRRHLLFDVAFANRPYDNSSIPRQPCLTAPALFDLWSDPCLTVNRII